MPASSDYVLGSFVAACGSLATADCPLYVDGANQTAPSGGALTVLAFGAPCFDALGVYGTQLFNTSSCTTDDKLVPLAQAWLRGYQSTHGSGTPQAILVLGTRKAESQKRAATMAKHEARRIRDRLSPNSSLPNSLVYTPIEDWTNDDVWLYLMQVKNPWGHDNKTLLGMYQGASEGGECPLVVDTTTPSCGTSRFGCWVCTVVDKDRSMEAMIKNDEEKQWMLPLSEFRNKFLDVKEDWKDRDFRRMDRSLVIHKEGLLHGPYKQSYRKRLLLELLKAQRVVRETGPEHVRSLELISLEELEEIRRIWVKEKHEFEDCLPSIYEEALGKPYPKSEFDEGQVIAPEDVEVLRKVAASPEDPDELHFQLVRELLHIEQGYRTASRRAGIYDAFEKTLEGSAFDSEQEAYEFALERARLMKEAQEPVTPGMPPTSAETQEESTGLPGASL